MAVEPAAADALTYVEQAKRTATRVIDLPEDTLLRPIHSVGVIGAGTMGGGISMNFLSFGMPVVLLDATADALNRGVAVVRRDYEARAAKSKLTTDQVEHAMSLLTTTLDLKP